MATKGNGGSSGNGNNRSAVTGRYVTPGYAKSHPNTTVTEKRSPPPKPTKGK